MEKKNMTDSALQIIQQLNLFKEQNWLLQLKAKTEELSKETNFYKEKLVSAILGIGWCMDERPPLDNADNNSKPAFVGGAAGWSVLFLICGKANNVNEAVSLTKQLYKKMNWGQMEAHIDNHHGGFTNQDELDTRTEGCGFLKVWYDVAQILNDLFKEENLQIKVPEKFEGSDFITEIKTESGKIVPLDKEHKTNEAFVVVNFVKNKTLDRSKLYEENPAFLWDAWATANEQVLKEFNTLAKTQMNLDQFAKLQAGLHLVTGFLLNALRLENNKNLVILE